MRVLITGVTGFAGRHLATVCRGAGATVVGLARAGAPAAAEELVDSYIAADLTDPEATRRAVAAAAPERVFHLAADASVRRSWADPRQTLTTNWSAALNLLEAVRAEAPRARVLLTGSGEVYAADMRPLTEEAPVRPRSPYALSKAAIDLMGEFYGAAITRAFNHTGPGQSDTYVVPSFARQIATAEANGRERVELRTGDLRPRRDFADVRDVVRAYWLVLERGDPGLYNVCTGRATAIADILAMLSAHARVEVVQRTDPELLRPGEVMEVRGSHARLTAATGWQPEIPLERTLGDTLDWWRAGR